MYKCKSCLYYDNCGLHVYDCYDYYPADGDEFFNIEDVIADGRDEFYSNWTAYMSDYNDDMYFL